MPEIVFDSCALSNFAGADVLPILERMYGGSAYVTGFGSVEIVRGIRLGRAGLERIESAVRAGWLKETNLWFVAEKSGFDSLSISLGLGEASSLAMAANRGWVYASDDGTARRAAEALGVKLTGTAGILIKAAEKRIITRERADEILARMIANGFHAPIKSIKGNDHAL